MGIDYDTATINQFINQLATKNLIKITQNKISYPPFQEVKTVVATSTNSTSSDNQQWQQLLALLKKPNRPVKLSALRNTIKAHTRLADNEVEKIIAKLRSQKKISVDNDKIQYW